MATAPWFVISPNTLVSLIGLIRGPDKTEPTPVEDWRTAVIDVVIPAFREQDNIAYTLSSLMTQSMQPRQVILVDDGGKDATVARAREFAQANGMNLTVIERASSIGKTPTIKRQAREFDSDVEFILDGDTFLESPDYIARCVQELYQGVGIASACGTILPMRMRDRSEIEYSPPFRKYLAGRPYEDPFHEKSSLHHLWWWITNTYRDCLYKFLQRFVYLGQMVFFGGITNPVGCAVAYRRKYIKDLFDRYEPLFGDDLTNSEDIFIGFALNNEGYRNIQLQDVQARSEEPQVQKLPRQVYLWSSSFLQSCYYFDALMRSPFKAPKRLWQRIKRKNSGEAERIEELRKIKEAYRQPFGEAHTRSSGRPIGWVIFMSAFEKIGFPTAMIILILLKMWEPLAVTIAAEVLLSTFVLTLVSKGERLRGFFNALLVTPLRYALMAWDVVTISRFAIDLWITGNRKWRK
ncbi:glycosyltransferase family 2 protein [Arenimonas sp. GDDSR-1]|uniref:glycosyltransferase family 2 protein n=1 Tax=Arenimonas sp. GDDSR-1 TaxID=2950125 RepID=UPI0026333F5E|nr:glycosyltransferase family 2 protein [Arenimonas sp. GDDSR-1]